MKIVANGKQLPVIRLCKSKIDILQVKRRAGLMFVKELEQSESEKNRLVRIIEETGDVISMGTPDNQILYMNKTGKKKFFLGNNFVV